MKNKTVTPNFFPKTHPNTIYYIRKTREIFFIFFYFLFYIYINFNIIAYTDNIDLNTLYGQK